jgi:hypothetical protein
MTLAETYKKCDHEYQLAYAAFLSGAISVNELQEKRKAKTKAFNAVKKNIKNKLSHLQ